MPEKSAVRNRRTQEERSIDTRGRIIRGAAKCIVEQGYKAATMKGIADAAGITWGAIQHHFGDKESILKGVTDLGTIEFQERVQHINLTGKSLQKRVDAFLEQARRQTEDELYLATMVIFRNKSQRVSMSEYPMMKQTLDDIWTVVFGDIKMAKKRSHQIRDFTFMSINAIAMERMSFELGYTRMKTHYQLLSEFLVSSLGK